MAVAAGTHYQAACPAMTTARVSIENAKPGDLVVLIVTRPAFVAAGPVSWLREGNGFLKVISEGDDLNPRFTADGAFEWEWEVLIVRAGTYSLEPTSTGTVVRAV